MCAMGPTGDDLLAEIERDLLDGKPLADLLRKCVLLGGRAGSVELRDWASRELKGYGRDDELPAYRVVGAVIQLDGVAGSTMIRGQQIAVSSLPEFTRGHIDEEFPLRSGVAELEAMSRGKETSLKLALPGAAEIARIMNAQAQNPFQHIDRLYWHVSTIAVAGVVDQVRTVLAELVGELRASMPPGRSTPTAEQTAQAIHIAINGGKRNTTVIATAQAGDRSTVTVPDRQSAALSEPWWQRVPKKIWGLVVGAATIAAAVFAYWALPPGH